MLLFCNRIFPFLFLFLLFPPSSILAQDCLVSSEGVDIRLRNPPSSVGATDRREHIRISQGLLDALCVNSGSIRSDGDNSPQVRVVITNDGNPGAPTSPKSSGLFTIVGVDTSSNDQWIEIYNRRDADDKNNGLRKLFSYVGNSGTINPALVSAEVYSIAPHATSFVDYNLFFTRILATTTHYNDPNLSNRQFEEYLQLEDSKNLALLVPHSEDIETDLEDAIGRFEVGARSYGVDTNIWEGRGRWGDLETFRRWHITSSDFHAASFPGLQTLVDAPDFETGRPFAWAVGLHGFAGRELKEDPEKVAVDNLGAYYGVVIGGRAHRESKCHLAINMRNRYGNRRDQVAITIFYHDNGNNVRKYEIPGLGGVIRNNANPPQPLAVADGLAGVARANIANRLAPWNVDDNAPGQKDRGGIQLELSKSLRFDEFFEAEHAGNPQTQLFENTISAVAQGLGQLIGYPDTAVGACEVLEDLTGVPFP